ncbi:LysR family transcriptional regulator [Celerinatantimonas sp. YJH-8]|uniref:LysR family transcriptional regulator n=1 Tax=Celerinatantimonas sp. YJH-8 TaxID=3228714 RepID=UPI0038C5C798
MDKSASIPSKYLQDTTMRYFLEVVRSGSISEAASRLNVAASAVSRQISGLEDKLDTPLFERRKSGMIPTAAGELLAAYAFRNQLETEKVAKEIQELQGLQRGEIKLVCTAGFSLDFIPQVIASFREKYPHINFKLSIAVAEEVVRRIVEGECDVGVTFSQIPMENLHVAYRCSSPLMAVVPHHHQLAHKKRVTLNQLSGYPIAVPERHILTRRLFDACCSRQNLMIQPALETTSISSLLAFVRYANGVCISAHLVVKQYLKDHNLVAVPIVGVDINGLDIEINTLSGRTLPKAVSTFVEHLKFAMQAELN